MGGQYRENWKRLTGRIPSSVPADSDADITRQADGGAGWVEIARGIVSTGATPISVGTMQVGKSYIIYVLNSTVGNNWTPGDEGQLTAIHAGVLGKAPGSDIGTLTPTNPSFVTAEYFAELIELVPGSPVKVDVESVTSKGDKTRVRLHIDDGDITVEHINAVDNTNGIYLVLEK